MQPVGREAAGVPGEGKPRTGHLGIGQLAVESRLAGECLELERVTAAGEEIAEPEHQPVGAGGGRPRRGRPFALWS